MLLGLSVGLAAENPSIDSTRATLDAGWKAFSIGLEEAKASLEAAEYSPPPATERVLAEGYRYLLGHLGRLIEMEMRAHPKFPEFLHTMDMLRKWTGENPDAAYLKAPIDASGYYRVTVQAADTSEWRTFQRHMPGPKAPRLVIFQTITDIVGNTGKLGEMANCNNQTLDSINSLALQIDDHNRFAILVGPQRPEGYQGNFLLSRKLMPCHTKETAQVREAQWLSVREIFSDWENEQRLLMDITRLDSIGASRPPLTAREVSAKLATIGAQLPHQIQFWSQLQSQLLELHGDANQDGERPLQVNGIYQPKPPFTAGGVAAANTLYASGKFELAADEALVIKATTPVEPYYMGFMLNNFWLEGPDQQNYVSSLTASQLPPASDGSRYYVIAHKDPGVRGWVSTTGLPAGSHLMRFVFGKELSAAGVPQLEAKLLKLDQLGSFLPPDIAVVSAEQRRQQIALRQRHIKQRWL